MAKSKYIDVNKEQYLEALFLDLDKHSKMISMDDRRNLISTFVMNNPSNADTEMRNGLTIIEGRVLIGPRKRSKKK